MIEIIIGVLLAMVVTSPLWMIFYFHIWDNKKQFERNVCFSFIGLLFGHRLTKRPRWEGFSKIDKPICKRCGYQLETDNNGK